MNEQKDRDLLLKWADNPMPKSVVITFAISAIVLIIAAFGGSILGLPLLIIPALLILVSSMPIFMRYALLGPLAREVKRLRDELDARRTARIRYNQILRS